MFNCTCGRELTANDRFCPSCGKHNTPPIHTVPNDNDDFRAKEGGSLINAFAYILPMFCIPMLLAPGDPRARHNANQGMLLCSISFFSLFFAGAYYVGVGLMSGVVDIFSIHLLFNHPFAVNLFASRPLVWLPMAIPGLYVTICSVVGFIRCLQKGTWKIPLFGNCQILRL
ncbi:MAG: hypothetical protein ACK5LL_07695 [Suipraeoptans sp.]